MLKLINILSNINPLLLLQTYHYLCISHLHDSFVVIIKGEIVGKHPYGILMIPKLSLVLMFTMTYADGLVCESVINVPLMSTRMRN